MCIRDSPHSNPQADAGGLVSPGGLSYIGRSKEILGEIPGAVAIKRMDLDDALAREAQKYMICVCVCVCVCVYARVRMSVHVCSAFMILHCIYIRAGVDLREEHPVKDVKFDKEKGLWTVTIENSKETFQVTITY